MVDVLQRKRDLIVHSAEPLNAEPPPDRLSRHYLTSVADFYIRTHGTMPVIDPATHAIRIVGRVARSLAFTVAELQGRFAAHTVTAAMQCAGNRRADLQQVEATSGDPWGPGAIGNATWTGVRLSDVLEAAGAQDGDHLHVGVEGADIAVNETAADAPYEISIPMVKARSPEVLLAWAMNGEPLTREHGAPLRLVVPGFAGVRSPKWVTAIRVQDKPSDAFQQAHDYLLFPPAMRKADEDLSQGVTIEAMPLTSAICEPAAAAAVTAGPLTLRGYAFASDRAVVRVDVSSDGGRAWHQAIIEDHGRHRWGWTLWHATLELHQGDHELVVRAWDAAGQTQPASPDETWNFKGYLAACWHRIRVHAA